MAKDLLKSLAELENMLHSMEKEEGTKAILENLSVDENALNEDTNVVRMGSYVRVSEDCMHAWVYLNAPVEGVKDYTRWEIVQFLRENGVVSGFIQEKIAAIVDDHIYDEEVHIAVGKLPMEGKEGFYEYFFDTSDKRKPAIRDDGTVDYTSVYQLSNVRKGDVVAVYHPAVQSVDGFDVLGKTIPAKPVRELPPLRGRGAENHENPNVYVATADGKIDFVDGRIDIKNIHEISGDVDLTVGKVEFFGDVHITGNVGAGVLIRAGRNVVVNGFVEGATIYAGGDVVLTRGINGGNGGKIVAKGSISAEFIENTTVDAGGMIRSNSFINSQVYSADFVCAEGKKGIILGGKVRGLLGVKAENVGNEHELKTAVSSGYSTSDYEHYLNLVSGEKEMQEKLTDVLQQMTDILKLVKNGREKIEHVEMKLSSLNEKKDKYFNELENIRFEKEELGAVIEKGRGSYILISDKICRGTMISIEGARFVVKDTTRFVKYSKEGGAVIGHVVAIN